jgi:hypothetical protein
VIKVQTEPRPGSILKVGRSSGPTSESPLNDVGLGKLGTTSPPDNAAIRLVPEVSKNLGQSLDSGDLDFDRSETLGPVIAPLNDVAVFVYPPELGEPGTKRLQDMDRRENRKGTRSF